MAMASYIRRICGRRFHDEAPRPGTTVLECLVAMLVLSLAMLGFAQLVAAAAGQRRLTAARSVALQEVANQAERIAAAPWEATAPGELTGWEPSAPMVLAIPDAVCRIHVTEEPGPPAGRRIRFEVVWPDVAGRQQRPVGLTVWKFQPEGQP